MQRRSFSISLLSAVVTLPAASQRILAHAAEAAGVLNSDILDSLPVNVRDQAAGTVSLLPIGYEGDAFAVIPVTQSGEILTRSVSFDVTPPLSPRIAARLSVPVLKSQEFPMVDTGTVAVQGIVDFGPDIGGLSFSAVALDSDRVWTAKGIRVASTGEDLTIQATVRPDAHVIITEWLGVSALEVYFSPALQRLLEQRGVDINEIIDNAVVPNLRQRVVPIQGGIATIRVPDPPLSPEVLQDLETLQVTIWSPVPITVLEREDEGSRDCHHG